MIDYEKKYNEALEWMRRVYPPLTGAVKEDAEHYFPELRESEDERIRGNIVNLVKQSSDILHPETQRRMLSYLEKQKEQKPAEWSEEDEKMIWNIISIVGHSRSGQAEEMIDWLKSLRPSWKPSDEQMEALHTLLSVVPRDPALYELYEQLRKLM